ncbi:MAG: PadR family transcriptional regulator [Cyclobacteriaceae bacterium]
MYSKELLKGTLRTIVLKLLAEHGTMYGYEITQKTKELTGGKIVLTEGALYPLLHKLEAEGYLVTNTQSIGKRIRKYYELTPEGDEKAISLSNEFADFVQTVIYLLNPSLAPKT